MASDDDLGMRRPIDRRDFLDGVALTAGALGLAGCSAGAQAEAWPQDRADYQPPLLTGLRGSHPGAFEGAHALRDGTLKLGAAENTGERYDLVVVGGGLSGLAAARFWRDARPGQRILVLDNHDDFGGHAKRNEFQLGGKLHLMNGGTMLIDSPRPYSAVAGGLLGRLGVDPVALSAKCYKSDVYPGLGHGVFFDAKTFGADRLVSGAPGGRFEEAAGGDPVARWRAFLAKTPLSEPARRDILRLQTGKQDYLPGLSEAAKADRLSRISYAKYLTDIARADPGVVTYYQASTHGEWAMGIDAVSALDCWGFDLPGFGGIGLTKKAWPRMSFTPAGYVEGGSATFHFPDGNATLARLLVRDLVPGSLPGRDATDIVTARCDYSRLDRPGQPVRIRLGSVAVAAKHAGPGPTGAVTVTYVRGGRAFTVAARNVIMAGWNAMIPHIVPELPAAQKAALHALVKAPLVYTAVALRDWRAWQDAGVRTLYAPGGFHSTAMLNWPVDVGGCTAERDPAKPILAHMTRTPCAPGLPADDQNRAGRAELLGMPFETFERETRAQLAATFPALDPARDITAITVNRWPHGYAPEYNYLWSPDVPADEMPHVVGRARFGRIAIANSDSGNGAYTDVAIDQAWRAVGELLG